MTKPKVKTKKYLDYNECRNFLEEKYEYKERDYLGKFKYQSECLKEVNAKFGKSWYNTRPAEFTEEQKQANDLYNELMNNGPEYKDFWHWVCDHYEIHNGCFITFSQETLDSYEGHDDGMPEWVKTIYGYYLKEFADENGEVEMYVSW